MRVGVVTNHDNGKGLQRDYELLGGVLRGWGHEVLPIHFRCSRTAPACDLLIFMETLETRFFDAAPRRLFVPNPEWWDPTRSGDLDAVDAVLCKTRDAERIFAAIVGDRATYTGWLSDDRHDADVPRRRVFLHTPGDSNMKGTAAILEAWQRRSIQHQLVIVGAQGGKRLPKTIERRTRLADGALRRLQNECAFHLCPSAYEGYGHTLHEALSVGAAIITTDAAPMNEVQVVAARVQVARTETLRSAVLAHAGADAIADAVERVAALPDEALATLRADARAEYLAGRALFLDHLQAIVGGETAASVPGEVPVAAATERPRPRLAICLPSHASGAALLRRTVLALRAQTAHPDLFEVVIGADGGDPAGVIAAAVEPGAHPFRCRIVESPRPRGEVPHRNHARNAAWRAAEAALCWCLDADFTLEPTMVEHILAEHDAALERGAPAVFSTCMAAWGGVGPADWLLRSQTWADGGDPAAFVDLWRTWPVRDDGIFNGYPAEYSPGSAVSVPKPEIHEGMPIVWRGLLNVMGGFDEEFGEWGDDKVELVDRLKGLAAAGLFEMRVVVSSMALHQPHERDPASDSRDARKRQNRRNARLRQIQTKSAWWRPQVEAARDALPAILAPLRPVSVPGTTPAPPARVRVPAPPPMPRRALQAADRGRPPVARMARPKPAHGFSSANHHFLATEALAHVLARHRPRPATVAVVGGAGVAWSAMERNGYSVRRFADVAEVEGDVLIVFDSLAARDGADVEEAGRIARARLPRKAHIVVVERTGRYVIDGRPMVRAPVAYQTAFAGLSLLEDYEIAGDRWSILAGRLM